MSLAAKGQAQMQERLERFIRQMPKVELHLHLEGSIRPATLLHLAHRHGVELPATDVEGLARWYRFRDFLHFVEIYVSICSCLRDGADRIAHGVRAVEDHELLAYLAEHRIGCDVCPTSNVCLGVYPSIAQHPIRRLIKAGVPVTIKSDDPPMFNTTLTDELLALAQAQAFTAAELAALVRTGIEVSFLYEAEKAALRARIDAELVDAARQAGIGLGRDAI